MLACAHASVVLTVSRVTARTFDMERYSRICAGPAQRGAAASTAPTAAGTGDLVASARAPPSIARTAPDRYLWPHISAGQYSICKWLQPTPMHACRRRCARTNAVVTARSCGDTPHRRADRRQGRVEHAREAIGCRFARRLHADASQHPAAAACQACRRLCVSSEKRVLVAGWHRCLSTRARRRRGFCDKSVGEVRPSGGAVAQCEHPS